MNRTNQISPAEMMRVRDTIRAAHEVADLPIARADAKRYRAERDAARLGVFSAVDECNQEYRRANSWKFTALLTWALMATAVVLFVLSRR